MINEPAKASVYTDFQGLAELRVAAGRQTPEVQRETARQFEALFVQSMLQAMRAASPGDGLFDSDKSDFYRDIYDRQLAMEMVKGRGLGIADMLMRSMGAGEAAEVVGQQVLPARSSSLPVIPGAGTPVPLIELDAPAEPLVALAGHADVPAALPDEDAEAMTIAGMKDVATDWQPQDPEEFIRDLLPVARKGAARLGVDPAVLVAQAALETGWGRKMVRHADGRNSYNLFGIKADRHWDGDRATVTTLEYEQGVPRRERAAFRAYPSLEDSVADYVAFLQGNPRYTQAIENTDNSEAYLRELKDAGYATDPDYVEKIRAIMDGTTFARGMDQLALSEAGEHTAGLW